MWGWIEENVSIKPYVSYIDKDRPWMGIWVGCYDIWTGEYGDCIYELALVEKEPYSGGHEHNGNRPIGTLRLHEENGEGNTYLSGNTENEVVLVEYLIPEVSGEIKLDSYIPPPRGYTCINPSDCLFITNITVEIAGLIKVPPSGQGTYRLTGSYGDAGVTSKHVENHYAKSSSFVMISSAAYDYFEETGIAIGINDMSLELGGLFDIHNNWKTPHSWHRFGTSVDIDHLGVKEKLLNRIAKRFGCTRYEVSLIHYECPSN